jgi:hypothetical protein
MQDNFLRPAVDAVHPACPLHLIGGLQCLCHALLPHHGSLDGFKLCLAGGVYLRQMGEQLFRQQQRTVKGWPVVFQIGAAHPAILADVILLCVLQREIGDQVVPA